MAEVAVWLKIDQEHVVQTLRAASEKSVLYSAELDYGADATFTVVMLISQPSPKSEFQLNIATTAQP